MLFRRVFQRPLKRLALILLILLIAPKLYAQQQESQEPEQQINDFSLSGFGEKGRKTWDLTAKSADIFPNEIKLLEVLGNLYNEKEQIRISADRGTFDKVQDKVHLEKNVVITTSTGGRLTTDTLDWDRKSQKITTKDILHISKENIFTVARGALGEMNLNHITLEKEVKVDIIPAQEKDKPTEEKEKIVITCDGPLEIDYAKNIATFKNNVKVDTQNNLMYSDIMDVYFVKSEDDGKANSTAVDKNATIMGAKIEKIVSRGNVRIIRGENISYSDEAVYTALDKKIVLNGRPKLVIYSTEDLSASFGN